MDRTLLKIIKIVRAWMAGLLTDYEAMDKIRVTLGIT